MPLMRLFAAILSLVMIGAACTAPDDTADTTVPPPTTAGETTTSTAGTTTTLAPIQTDGIPVILDYSPTVSDVGALLYLLNHPDVDVLAVTLPVAGEAACDLGAEVTLGILALADQSGIPVACDGDVPAGAEPWPSEFLTGQENLTAGLPATDQQADSRPAHQLIADIATASVDPVTIVAVAPLTNLARFVERHPDAVGSVGELAIMGGAVDAPGNVTGTNAEWNIWVDAVAAGVVFSSDLPITLVPLDATNDVPVPGSWPSDLAAAEQSPSIQYLADVVDRFPGTTAGFFYLWDELAAAAVTGGATINFVQEPLSVPADGDQRGVTIRDSAGASANIATGVVDPDAFSEHFLSTLAGAPFERAQLVSIEPPATVDTSTPTDAVLAYWLNAAIEGDVDAAGGVVADDAPWMSFWASPDAFVEGSAPFRASDVALECVATGSTATCEMVWNDLWIGPNPDLDGGHVRAQAVVEDGVITEFLDLTFDAPISEAFMLHLEWLQANRPEEFQASCPFDPTVPSCGELLVDTVEEWVANR